MAVEGVLDTNVVLYLLGGQLAEPLPEGLYFVSVVTEMESLSYPSLSKPEEKRVRSFLSGITVVGLTPKVKEAAIRLRRQHGIKLPDAVIAATARVLRAELLTNDLRLL